MKDEVFADMTYSRLQSKFGVFDCKMLINEVRKRPCLWNECHKYFKKTFVTNKQWDEVGQAINMPGEDCKKKWKNLKDTLRRKMQSDSLNIGLNKKWRFEKYMGFVRNSLIASVEGNISPIQELVEEDIKIQSEDEKGDVTHGNQVDNEVDATESKVLGSSYIMDQPSNYSYHEIEHPYSIQNAEEKKKDKQTIELEVETMKSILSLVKSTKEKEKGDDHHFFLSLLPYVSQLNAVEKLELRTKIQACVLDAVRRHCNY